MASKIPTMMRAAVIDSFGGPEVLQVRAVPVPELHSGEVLIAVQTAGVGSWDADIRGGWWPEGRPQFPLILGTDGSGQIAAAGSRVRRLKVGEKVYGYSWLNPQGGFYAEYVAVISDNVAHVPTSLDLRKAGAVPATGLTALQGVDHQLGIKGGESVIIHGASGGVGTLALQFAKLRGARVLATASGSDGKSLAGRLGADMAVDGKHEDIAAAARAFAPDGIDAVLAFAGGNALEQCIQALRRGGLVAYPKGVQPEPEKQRGIRIATYDAVPGVREFEQLQRAVEGVRLKVPIARAYPLVEAAKAHQHLAEGHILGKVVLKIR